MLSKSAFNAMLKTLEEPPEHVKFVLATTDPQKIPITVLSRCLQFNLKQIPPVLIADYLRDILTKEHIPADDKSLALIARAAQGSMRDALSILDQAIAFGEGKIIESTVREMLGVIDQSHLYAILDALAEKNGKQILAIATEMDARCLSFETALQDLAAILHSVALFQTIPEAINEDLPEYQNIVSLAETFAPEDIQLFYQIALHGRQDLPLAPDEYAGFTMSLIRMLAFMPDDLSSEDIAPEKQTENIKQIIHQPGSLPNSKTEHSPTPSDFKNIPGTAATPQNWPELVKHLKLKGMAKMLAHHSEAKQMTADTIELLIPEIHKHLLDKKYQSTIKSALDAHFGRPVKLSFTIGSITGMTPVAIQQQENEQKQAQAIAAIEKDPVVQDLVDSFDAKIIESSIKPIQTQGEQT